MVGDGNVVNTSFAEVSELFADMRSAVLTLQNLDDEAKLDVIADIDTLQGQLQKTCAVSRRHQDPLEWD